MTTPKTKKRAQKEYLEIQRKRERVEDALLAAADEGNVAAGKFLFEFYLRQQNIINNEGIFVTDNPTETIQNSLKKVIEGSINPTEANAVINGVNVLSTHKTLDAISQRLDKLKKKH